jgi:hypothetical protein
LLSLPRAIWCSTTVSFSVTISKRCPLLPTMTSIHIYIYIYIC